MLTWFDADPTRYWALAWSSLGLLGCTAFLPAILGLVSEHWEKRALRLLPPWFFVAAMALSFAAFRWPLWTFSEELNPDESQLIAGAVTLPHDPVYWRAVDGTTHGPLDTYALLVPRLFGLPFSYASARIVGAAIMFGLIYACYRTACAYGREATARIAAMPAFCFLAFITFNDFTHYSSEHVPAAMLALGFFLLAREVQEPSRRRGWSWGWLAGGGILGAVPLAKPQGAPIAACLLLTATAFDLGLSGIPFTQRLKRLLTLFVAAVLPLLLAGAVVWLSGCAGDAWKSYVVQNIRYAGDRHRTHLEMVRQFWTVARRGELFYPFAAGCATFGAIALLPALSAGRAARRFIWLTLIFLLVSLVAVLAPGRQYHHYLLFLIAPACLLAGGSWQACWQATERRPSLRWARGPLLALFATVVLVPQINARRVQPHPFVGQLARSPSWSGDPVAAEIMQYAKPGESLAVWGWMSRFHVYTGLRQATREAHTVLQIQWTPQIDYFRARYLADLQRSRPPVFVDAVGPGNFVFQDRSLAHESFEPLRRFIAENYRPLAERAGCRIYVRLDRCPTP